jgi:hypothetical protein
VTSPLELEDESGDGAFGDEHWRGVFDQPADHKWGHLVDAYRASLHKAGFQHVLAFEVVDQRGSQLWLMFGTNSNKGVEKMKDAMWAVDPAYGVRYRDPRDPNQITLDIEQDPDTAPLSRMLLDILAAGPCALGELREYALLETVYRPQQVRGVVQRFLTEGRLSRTQDGHLSGTSVLHLTSSCLRRPEQPTLFDVRRRSPPEGRAAPTSR